MGGWCQCGLPTAVLFRQLRKCVYHPLRQDGWSFSAKADDFVSRPEANAREERLPTVED